MSERRKSSVVQVARADDGVVRVNDAAMRQLSVDNPNIVQSFAEAKAATAGEHELTIRDAIRLYPKAIAFSIIFSTAVVMEGYDLSLMGSFFGLPPFRNFYGTEDNPAGGRQVSAPWQSGILNGTQVGSIIGLWLNGILSDKFGYRKTMFGSLVLMIAFIFLPVFAQNIQTLLAGAILCGLPWGVFQTITVTYASDVTPTVLRPYLTSYVNLCWVIGQFIAAGVLRSMVGREDQLAYRLPFALQWIWPPLILIGVFLAPESPWWLVRHGRYDDAKNALLKLTNRNSGIPFDADKQVAMIKATDDLEKAINSNVNYWDCFKSVDRRRTEITCMVWVTQAFCGAALMGFAVQFYERAGLDTENSFNFNLGQYAMGAVGTVASWFLMPHFGRRTLYLWGLAFLFCMLMIVGGMGVLGTARGPSLAAGTLLMIYTFVYDFTIGPVCYALVADIPSTRLKIKTVVLARNLYNVGGIINNVLMPRMLLNTNWNWGAKTGFFWAGACLLLFIYHYFRLPEPKGRTYGELDVLFENRVSARKFRQTKVDQFAGHHTDLVAEDSSDGEKKGAAQVESVQ
ncbi:uncharacterized protein HMPREF1541_05832 [Cyphellophora europaea CBS 101466]|uniref:Major facilitator superfamily (MFS) profile domain-containing protein n=1 Tax=Cyphellophora europaea (strain CBS 101466) TaxID=1220924 RepID=W2RSW0_CYPE1|nr:uncharacterized protein HMPREF1541_05832 [Cyphellophora europaea CBS 101466]ETN39606.1 hypothetical protein HMPREF1541_05832 [Cyphellophora europaea CBS 101466]